MKLISLNVGLSEKNNDKLAKFLKAQKADILNLQEVVKRIDTTAFADYISKDTIDNSTPQLKECFFAPIWILSKFEKDNFHGKKHFLDDFGGKIEFGNYIKTRYPLLKGQNIFVQNHFSHITDWSKWPEDDCRAVQVVDLHIKGNKLRLLNYHGIWSKDKKGTDKTLKACEIIRKIALEVSYPVIITGDFNLFPDSQSITVLSSVFNSLVDTYNIKTTRPSTNELHQESRNVVDYIFTSKEIKINDFQVVDSDVSDHLPLMMDFEL